jgi:tetratricopeptide (TPR) repeat protein
MFCAYPKCCRIKKSVAALIILIPLCVRVLEGQFLPRLQAHSEAEFDAYLEVERTGDPDLCQGYAKAWPESELLPRVFEIQFESYRSHGDLNRALAAGTQALKAYPDNLTVEVELAELLAESDRPAEARKRAERVLNVLRTFRSPSSIQRERWLTLKANLESDAHASLGLVDYRQGDLEAAVREFETAVRIRRSPEPTQYLRLGRLYRTQGRYRDAKAEFEQVLATTEQKGLRELASKELQDLANRP